MPSTRGASPGIMPAGCLGNSARPHGFSRHLQAVLLVLWLLALGVGGSASGSCPPQCKCNVQDRVDCSDAGLQSMPDPSLLPSSTTEYILSGNAISNIDSSDLQGLSRLKLLFLDRNRLSSDQDLALAIQGLSHLEQLYLGSNQFRSFHLKYFDDKFLPKVLNISDNPLVTFDAEPNSKIPVETLYINNVNLAAFPSQAIDEFADLKRLYATGNRFGSIPSTAFDRLTKLIELDLSYSSLVTLPAGLFNQTKALKSIYLTNGSLETLEEGIFDSIRGLTTVDLAGNPLACNCSLSWLPAWLTSSRKVQFSNPGLTSCRRWPGKPFLDVPTYFMCPTSYGTCVYNYEREAYSFHKFSTASANIRSERECQQQCFEKGHSTYFHNANNTVCLCGDESTTCACSSDSPSTSGACGITDLLLPADHVLVETHVSVSSPVRLGDATQFSVSSVLTGVVEYRWNFHDGSDPRIVSSSSLSHTFLLTGNFSVNVELCGAIACQRLSVWVRVVSLSDLDQWHCPTAVKVLDKINISADIWGSSDAQISWSRVNTKTRATAIGGHCATGWQLYHGRCLQKSTSKMDYSQAQSSCASHRNASLLTVFHPLEQADLITLFSITDGVYTGARQSAGQYLWMASGSPAYFSPTDLGATSAQECVLLTSATLAGVECTERKDFICEQDVLQCDEGHLVHEDSCFYLLLDEQSWPSAQQACSAVHSGRLAIVSNDSLLTRLHSHVLSSSSSPDAVWVGLRSRTMAGHYQWSDYSTLTVGQWSSASPHLPCGALSPTGQWQDLACGERHAYICQYSLSAEVTNGQYAAGILDLLDNGSPFQTITPTSQPVTRGNSDFHLTLLPGSWFPRAGRLQRWMFHATRGAAASDIALQVYRPTCPSGQSHIPPGCGQNRISICGQSSACPLPACSSSDVYCSLSQLCQSQGTPCNCLSIPASSPTPGDCNQHSSNLTYPSYTLVGETYFTVPGSGIFMGDAGNLAVEAYDIIGFQTRGHNQLTLCKTNLTSQWRNTLVDSDVRAWMGVGEAVAPEGSWSRQENVLCYIAVSYADGTSLSLPENLAYVPIPGQFQFQYKTADGTISSNCNVEVEEAVEQMRWLYPVSVPRCPSSITVEQDAEQLVVVHVQRGSNLTAVWHTSQGQTTTDFVSGCSSSLTATVPECLTATSFTDKPFSITTLRFPNSGTLTLSVQNKISSDNCTVHIRALIKIRGLTYFHSSCTNHTNCHAMVETGVPQTFITRIQEGFATEYFFEVDGTAVGDRTKSNLTYTFQLPGIYRLSVNASNELNSVVAYIEVEAKIRANFHNYSFLGTEHAVFIGDQLPIIFSAAVDLGANITVTWVFSDGASNVSTMMSASNVIRFTIVHPFNQAGNQTVAVFLEDEFETISDSFSIEVIYILPDVSLMCQSIEVAANTPVSFNATLASVGAAYLGPLTFTWDFSDGSRKETTHTYSLMDQRVHSFSAVGVYNVTVEVRSLLDVKSDVVSIIVEEAVIGLGITNDGPKNESETVTFTIVKTSGTNLKYNVSFDDGSAPVVQTDPVFTHAFARAGQYTVSVTASNLLGQETAEGMAYIMNSTTLLVLKIKRLNCTKTGQSVTLAPKVINVNPGALNYSWVCQGGRPNWASGIGLDTMTTTFDRPGMHPVSVTVSSDSDTESASGEVCVQDVVSDLVVSSPGFVGLESGLTSTAHLSALANGTNVTFTWRHDGRVAGRGAAFDFNVRRAGTYVITVIAQNDVSQINQTMQLVALDKIDSFSIACAECQTNNSVAKDAAVNLRVTSHAGTNVSYVWVVEGQNSGTGPNLTYTFTSEGGFLVQTEAVNTVSNITGSIIITVMEGVAGLNVSKNATIMKTGEVVLFQASITNGSFVEYTWTCNSTVHQKSSLPEVAIAFSVAGMVNCSVTAANSATNSTQWIQVYVYESLSQLTIGHNLVDGKYASANESTTLTALANTFYGTNFTWTVVDSRSSSQENAEGKDLHYSFPTPSDYAIHLRACNPISSINASIHLSAIMKISGVDIESNYSSTLSATRPVNVTAVIERGSNVSYTWKHRVNNQEQTLPYSTSSFIQTFASSGTHVIRLNVSNVLSSGEAHINIHVEQPVGELKINSSAVTPGHPYIATRTRVTLWATSAGDNLLYIWTVRKGLTPVVKATSPQLTHLFGDSGVYTIILEAKNGVSYNTTSVMIFVEDRVTSAHVNVSQTFLNTSDTIFFMAEYQGPANSKFNWSVDGTNIDKQDFMKRFQTAGTYTINLEVYNNVSHATDHRDIIVEDPIVNLHFNGCNSFFPSEKPVSLQAGLDIGTDVEFLWSVNSRKENHGPSIPYTFLTAGQYTITLDASNHVSRAALSCVVTAQDQVKISNVLITPDKGYLFLNHTVNFRAVPPLQNAGPLTYTWMFSGVGTFDEHTVSERFLHTFQIAGDYELTVHVENNVSSADFGPVAFTIHTLQCDLPHPQPVGSRNRTMLRSRSVDLEVTIDSGCGIYTAVHRWEVYRGSVCNSSVSSSVDLGSTSTTTPLLRIPPRVLDYGMHCVRFTTGYNSTPVQEETSFSLTVTSSALVALIAGGSQRVLSFGGDVTLDATRSYDPDLTTGSLPSSMTYQWSCSSLNVSGSCPSLLTKAVVSLPAGALPLGTYIFTLTISDGTRTATAKQTVVISQRTVPEVSLECVSCKAKDVYTISSEQHVALSGSCSNCASCSPSYSWTVTRNDGVALVPDSTMTTTGTSSANFVLLRGHLLNGHAYTFQLKVSCSGFGQEGEAALTLEGNQPPAGGHCEISPLAVSTLEPVGINCSGWADPDGEDLSFEVSVDRGRSRGGVYRLYKGPRSALSVYVAPWPDTDNDTVSLQVYVVDSSGAATLAQSSMVTITEPSQLVAGGKTEHLQSHAQDKLPELINQNNPVFLLQYVIALCQELNHESLRAPSAAHSNLTGMRATIRDAATLSLAGISVASLQDAQQLSLALQLLTNFSTEYQTQGSHLLVTRALGTIVSVLRTSASPGLSQDEFVPEFLLSTISNIFTAVNMGVYSPSSISASSRPSSLDSFFSGASKLREEIVQAMQTLNFDSTTMDESHRRSIISSAFEVADEITAIVLQTKMLQESSLTFQLGAIEVHGLRCTVEDVWTQKLMAGCLFSLPHGLLGLATPTEEIFQVMFVLPQNPFTWGYMDRMEISTRVPVLSFKYTNGSSISVKDLPDSQRIRILMFDSDGSNYTLQNESLIGSQHYKPLDKLDYKTETVKAAGDKKITLDVTQGTSAVSALHIQVRVTFQGSSGQSSTSNRSVSVFLGRDYEASRDSFEQYKTIHADYMADGVDHRFYTFFVPSGSFSNTSSYSLSVYNNHEEEDVELSVAMYLSSCQYFNTDSQQWDSSGCEVSDESIAVCTVCSCNHLTSFGGSILVPPNALDFTDLVQAIITNPAVMITISVILVLYILAVVLLRRLDMADLKRIANIPLCGVDGSFKYEITVHTGRQIGAGTSAHVGLVLYGEHGKSDHFLLSKPGAFGRNCQDKFLVAHDVSLGEIEQLLVWHDNHGTSPAWFLQHVEVLDLMSSHRTYFFANTWLSLEVENGTIEKRLRAAGPEELKSFKQKFKRSTYNAWAEKHLWMSIFDRPDHSRFSRVQRVTVCVTLVYVYMCASAMWYGLLKGGATARDPVTWAALGWEEVVVAAAAALITLPVGLLLVLIFKKSRPKASMLATLQKPPTAQSLEIEDHCGGLYPEQSFRTMTPELLSNFDRESTTDSLPIMGPIATSLRRTRNLTSSKPGLSDANNHGGGGAKAKSSVPSIQRMQNLMWSSDNIMRWPEQMPWSDELGGDIGPRKSPPSIPGPSHPINPPRRPSQQTFRNRVQSADDSDEEFEQRLAEIDRMEQAKITQKQRSLSKSSSQRTRKTSSEVDDLFSSDDEWAHDYQAASASGHVQGAGSKPAAPLHPARFNPREEPTIRPSGERRMSTSSILKHLHSGTSGHPPASKEVSFVSRDRTRHSLGGRSHSTLSSTYWRRMSLQPRAAVPKTGCTLPPWCVYLAYTLCAALSVFSVIVILLYGYKFGPAVSTKWLVSLLLVTLFSFFIVEPLKVLIMALHTACSSHSVEEEQDNDVFEVQPPEKSNEVFKPQKFRPVAGFALLQAKEEGRKAQRLVVMVRQTVMYLVMLVLLLVNCYLYFSPNCFRLSTSINATLSHTQGSSGPTLHNLSSIPDFWQWTQTGLVQTLHYSELTPSQTFPILLGLPRLRQIRSTTADCLAQSHLSFFQVPSLARECQGQLAFTEDQGSYSERWNTTGNQSWQYHSQSQLSMAGRQGAVARYGGGGYTQLLGASANETLSILQDLQSKDWVDLRTRAVFVEFTMYLPSQDLTSVMSILVEFPLSGGLLSSVDTQTQKLLRFIEWAVDPLMLSEVLYVLCVVYLLVHIVLTLREARWHFFTSLWSWVELAVALLSAASVGVYIGCVVSATEAFQHYHTHQPSTTFTNFEPTARLHVALRYMHAWLVFLFFLKIVKQARFFKCLHVFEKTLSHATWLLVGCCLLFTLLLCSYAQLGYLMFGVEFLGFRSFEAALLSLMGVVRGSFRFEEKMDRQPVFSPFFFLSFYTLAYGLFVGLVMAVLNSTYKLTRSQMYYKATLDDHDYEMIEFMMKRFKLLIGWDKPKPPFQRVRFEGLPSLPSRGTHSSHSSRSETDSLGSELSHLDASTQYMEYLVDKVAPQWQSILAKMKLVEDMDREEEKQTQRLEKAVKEWHKKRQKTKQQQQQKSAKQQSGSAPQPARAPERRHSQPSQGSKPPLDPSSRLARFKANFQVSAANAMKGTTRVSITPPSDPSGARSLLLERPSSDQSPRHTETLTQRPASDSQQKRSPLHTDVTTRPARKAWSPDDQS